MVPDTAVLAQLAIRARVNRCWLTGLSAPHLCGAACSRCRHAAIAKYFGDALPACAKGCDHCQNPTAVRRQLEALERSSSWSKTCIGPSQGNGFDPELYEGGRKGYGGFSR